MTDSSIRPENLNALCLRLGWISHKTKHLGSPSELINRLGRSLSIWSNPLTGRRPIGAKVAREIEEGLNLPKSSLDGDEEHSDFVQVSWFSVSVTEEPDAGSTHVVELGALQFRRDFLRSVDVSGMNAVGRMATKKEVALDTDHINHLAKQFLRDTLRYTSKTDAHAYRARRVLH